MKNRFYKFLEVEFDVAKKEEPIQFSIPKSTEGFFVLSMKAVLKLSIRSQGDGGIRNNDIFIKCLKSMKSSTCLFQTKSLVLLGFSLERSNINSKIIVSNPPIPLASNT
jgi:hypothetical protein